MTRENGKYAKGSVTFLSQQPTSKTTAICASFAFERANSTLGTALSLLEVDAFRDIDEFAATALPIVELAVVSERDTGELGGG